MPLPDRIILGPDGEIQSDLKCTKCAYLLRTMRLTDACPECGTPARTSIFNPHLAKLHAHNIQDICNGLNVLAIASGIHFLLILLLLYILSFTQHSRYVVASDTLGLSFAGIGIGAGIFSNGFTSLRSRALTFALAVGIFLLGFALIVLPLANQLEMSGGLSFVGFLAIQLLFTLAFFQVRTLIGSRRFKSPNRFDYFSWFLMACLLLNCTCFGMVLTIPAVPFLVMLFALTARDCLKTEYQWTVTTAARFAPPINYSNDPF